MVKNVFRKSMAVAIIALFIGASITILPNTFVKTAKADLTTDLVGYWSFNEGSGITAYDSSENNNHGTIFGATWTTDTPSGDGYALDFDGVDDKVLIPDSSSLDLTNSYTISAWVKKQGDGGEWDGVSSSNIVTKHYTHWSRSYILQINNLNNGYTHFIDPNDVYYELKGIKVVNDNEWTHIVGVYNYISGIISLYIDGEHDNSVNVGHHNIMQTDVPVLIGALCLSDDGSITRWNFNGIIDEVRIYNRALSEGEIEQLAGINPDAGLVAHWKFDESSGNTAYDSAGSYDGTLNGNPQWVSGKIGGALEFDGDGDFIITPLNQLGEQTISLWFKFDGVGNGALISTHIKNDNNGNFVIIGASADCGMRVQAIDRWWPPDLCAGSPLEYNDDQWHHCAFTHDGGYYELFVDGVSKDTYSGSALTDNRPYVMGRLEPSSAYPYWLDGMLDEVRIYSRVLSESEIQDLYGGGTQLVADAGGPYSGDVGQSITFTGSSTGGVSPYSWDWDFGDGSPHSDQQNPSHSYGSSGTYTATLTVTDDDGNTDADTTQVVVEIGNQPPCRPDKPITTSLYMWPYYLLPSDGGYACVPYGFHTETSDPEGDAVKFGWDWDGDDTVDEWTDLGWRQCSRGHLWESAGTYYIKVKAEDEDGAQSDFSDALEVVIHKNGRPGIPRDIYGDSTGIVWEKLTFSTYTWDSESDKLKFGWDWDGDDTVDEWTSLVYGGNVVETTHYWGSPDIYNVKVKAKDEHGAESGWSNVKKVIISNTGQPIAYIESISPDLIKTGQLVTFKGKGVDPDDDEILGHMWRSIRDGILYIGPPKDEVKATLSGEGYMTGHMIYFYVSTEGYSDPNYGWSEPDTQYLTVWDGEVHTFEPPYHSSYNDPNDDGWGVYTEGSNDNINTGAVTVYTSVGPPAGGCTAEACQYVFFDWNVNSLATVEATLLSTGGQFDFGPGSSAQKLQIQHWMKDGNDWVLDDPVPSPKMIATPSGESILIGILEKILFPYFPGWVATLKDAVDKICLINDVIDLKNSLKAGNHETITISRLMRLKPGQHQIMVGLFSGAGSVLGTGTAARYGTITNIQVVETYDSETTIIIDSYCPIDLVVVDPEGQRIEKSYSEIPYAEYIESDLNMDSDLDDRVYIPCPLNGSYSITVIPENGASPEDTYSLAISINGEESFYLAENVKIEDIPNAPYEYDVVSKNSPYIKLHFPINKIMVHKNLTIKWDAFDNEDGSNLPIFLYYSEDGENWYDIDCELPNTGDYIWNTNNVPDGVYMIKVETVDSDGNVQYDKSNIFGISNNVFLTSNHKPNQPAQPLGKNIGKPGIEYSYTTGTIDPDGDDIFYWFEWGDGTTSGWIGPYESGETCNSSHSWTQEGLYTIKVKAKDAIGQTSEWSEPLIVVIDVTSPTSTKTVGEPKYGLDDEWVTTATEFNFTATDDLSGVDKTYYRIWYDGSWSQWKEYSGNFMLIGEGMHYLEYYSVDIVGNIEEVHNQTHYVDIIAPEITALTLPVDPVEIDTTVILDASFFDELFADTHSATIDWGDGNTTSGTVDETNQTITASWSYAEPGVYTMNLTVEDYFGRTDSELYQYVVVYDPSAGFVTGGGWINSPEGAYTPDPTLTGKANFGFVSKYKKGQQEPEGNTEFQFHAAGMNFHSSSYDWLVITKHKAMYKGTGTINNAGNYGFMLSAIDEDHTPSTDVDLFRIKIWDKDNNDEVIYDNQLGEDEDADPSTEIGGGQIKIHKG